MILTSPGFGRTNYREKYIEPHRPKSNSQKVINGRNRKFPPRKHRLVYPEKNGSNSKLKMSSSEIYELYKKEKNPQKRKELYERYKKAKAREKKEKKPVES